MLRELPIFEGGDVVIREFILSFLADMPAFKFMCLFHAKPLLLHETSALSRTKKVKVRAKPPKANRRQIECILSPNKSSKGKLATCR